MRSVLVLTRETYCLWDNQSFIYLSFIFLSRYLYLLWILIIYILYDYRCLEFPWSFLCGLKDQENWWLNLVPGRSPESQEHWWGAPSQGEQTCHVYAFEFCLALCGLMMTNHVTTHIQPTDSYANLFLNHPQIYNRNNVLPAAVQTAIINPVNWNINIRSYKYQRWYKVNIYLE